MELAVEFIQKGETDETEPIRYTVQEPNELEPNEPNEPSEPDELEPNEPSELELHENDRDYATVFSRRRGAVLGPLLDLNHNVTFTGPINPLLANSFLCMMLLQYLTPREQVDIRRVCRSFYKQGTIVFLQGKFRRPNLQPYFSLPNEKTGLSVLERWQMYQKFTKSHVRELCFEVELGKEARHLVIPPLNIVTKSTVEFLTTRNNDSRDTFEENLSTRVLRHMQDTHRYIDVIPHQSVILVRWYFTLVDGFFVQLYQGKYLLHDLRVLDFIAHGENLYIIHLHEGRIAVSMILEDGSLLFTESLDALDPASIVLVANRCIISEVNPKSEVSVRLFSPSGTVETTTISQKYLDVYEVILRTRLAIIVEDLYDFENITTHNSGVRWQLHLGVTQKLANNQVLSKTLLICRDTDLSGLGLIVGEDREEFNRNALMDYREADPLPLEELLQTYPNKTPNLDIIRKFRKVFCRWAPRMRESTGLMLAKFEEIMQQEKLLGLDETSIERFPYIAFQGNTVGLGLAVMDSNGDAHVDSPPYALLDESSRIVLISIHSLGDAQREYPELTERCTDIVTTWTVRAHPIDQTRELWVIRIKPNTVVSAEPQEESFESRYSVRYGFPASTRFIYM